MVLNAGEEEALGISLQEHTGRPALCFTEVQPLRDLTKKSYTGEKQHTLIHPYLLTGLIPFSILPWMPIC